jgi:hypothetical protein
LPAETNARRIDQTTRRNQWVRLPGAERSRLAARTARPLPLAPYPHSEGFQQIRQENLGVLGNLARQNAAHGRGSSDNPRNRFETIQLVADPDAALAPDDERPAPRTVFLKDTSRDILGHNDSPDVCIEASINPYRGCEHCCIYCFARPTHEYLGFSAGLDFETRIMVKHDAPQLLRAALSSPAYKPVGISISGVTRAAQRGVERARTAAVD